MTVKVGTFVAAPFVPTLTVIYNGQTYRKSLFIFINEVTNILTHCIRKCELFI